MLLQMVLVHSFLLMSNIYIFCIHLSVDEHLESFHVSAIVNSTAVKLGGHVSFWISFLWIYARTNITHFKFTQYYMSSVSQ